MRNLICVHVYQVYHNVHFRHFGKLKLRFLLNLKLIIILCVLHIFGYICFGIRIFYVAYLFPILLLFKKLIFKKCPNIYICSIQCISNADST